MENFDELLQRITLRVQKKIEGIGGGKGKVRGTDFEKIVYEAIIAEGIDDESISHSVRKFPDFRINQGSSKFGIEVKKTDSDKWEVPGGSVYESLRNQIEATFVLMGKFGGEPEARYRKYEECISDLSVTHSPRFQLNLDIPFGEDYLTKNNAKDLLDISERNELNRRIRELLRTDVSTWYSDESIIAFTQLSPEEKKQFFVDGVVLFPEVTGRDYSKFAPWMTYKCLVWCGNVRDVFSAGGTKKYDDFFASAVMARIIERANYIISRIERMTPEELDHHWKCKDKNLTLEDKIEWWINLIQSKVYISEKVIDKNKESFPELYKRKRKNKVKEIIIERFCNALRKAIEEQREV